jgi:hypothetical protein
LKPSGNLKHVAFCNKPIPWPTFNHALVLLSERT